MNKKICEQVFNKYGGRCAYCGCELIDKWQVDHATSKHMWRYVNNNSPSDVNDISNLMPTCVPCNHYKRELSIESWHSWRGFRDYMLTLHIRLKKLPKKTTIKRTAQRIEYLRIISEKYNITPQMPFSGTFYFETLT